MIPTLVIGDLHLGCSWDGLDRTQDIFDILYKQVLSIIKEKIQNKNYLRIIWLGDIFHSSNASNTVISQFIDFLRVSSFHETEHIILKGNHDGEPTSTRGSPLQIIESTGLAEIVWEPQVVNNDLYIPYCTQQEIEGFNNIKEYKLCFTHVDIPGAIPGTEALISRGSPSLLPQWVINKCNKIISGHIHFPSVIGNIKILGSILRTSISEVNDKKRILYIDAEGVEEEIFIQDRDLNSIEFNIKDKISASVLTQYFKDKSFKGQILSIKIYCPSNLAHLINFKELEDLIRTNCFFLRFEFFINKEKEYRIKELKTSSVLETIKDYLEHQDISDKGLILKAVEEYILKEF